MSKLIFMILISYFIGSFPTSIIAGKIGRGIDIRQHGSGNAGATNVFRVLGWKAGLVVLLIDIGKGLVPTILIYKIAIGRVELQPVMLQIFAGLAAVAGHVWTVFAGFKGGKGVGTGAGMVIGLVPAAVLAGLIVFIVTVFFTRYVSLGSILASLTVPCFLFIKHFFLNLPETLPILFLGVLIPVLIIFTHRANIKRLFKGLENKLQFKKT